MDEAKQLTLAVLSAAVARGLRLDSRNVASVEGENRDSDQIDALPPILSPSSRLQEGSSASRLIEGLEDLSLAVRAAAFDFKPSNAPVAALLSKKDLFWCDASDLRTAIERAPAAGGGVKLVGVWIKGDLDLSKLQLPFSIRLISCWVEGSILLDRTRLTTLDLSGTVVSGGISANYADVRGAARFFRTVFASAVDFGGASVGGAFDASYAVLMPIVTLPDSISYVADRGMLNFALARLRKEVRLVGTRIYGGLNLRSAEIGGSLFLDHAIIRSTVNVGERSLCKVMEQQTLEKVPMRITTAIFADDLIGHDIFPPREARERSQWRRDIETFAPVRLLLPSECPFLERLLNEAGPEACSAIRAEGSRVKGEIHACSARFGGTVRLKQMRVGGGVRLSGSHLRAIERRDLETLVEICSAELKQHENWALLLRDAYDRAARDEPVSEPQLVRHNLALDMRDAHIGGSVDFRRDPRRLRDKRRLNDAAFRGGERKLIIMVVKRLCETGEDPIKFLPAFFPIYADSPHEFVERLKRQRDRTPPDPVRETAFQVVGRMLREFGEWLGGLWRPRPAPAQARPPVDPSSEEKRDDRAVDLYDELCLASAAVDPDYARYKIEKGLNPRGRVYGDLNSAIAFPRYRNGLDETVAETIANHGSLASTLIIGGLDFCGAEICGALRLRNAIANVFDEAEEPRPQRDRKSLALSLRNARIGGDLDLRDSIGLRWILAQQVEVRGSIRLAGAALYNMKAEMWAPVRGRALLCGCIRFFENGEDRDKRREREGDIAKAGGEVLDFGQHNFERAVVKGDAHFVFDKEVGPSLRLSQIRVDGGLVVLPARGGLELSPREIENDEREADSLRRNDARLYEVFATPEPEIRLRDARATVFAHPPSAWPQQDRLVINGLDYQNFREFGPFAPMRRQLKSRHREDLRNLYVFTIAILCVTLAGAASIALGQFNANLGGFAAVVFGGFILWGLQNYSEPNATATRALATAWLLLQKRRLNPRRRLAGAYPFQPFLQAAAVLRRTGRTKSAQEVEISRLRQRTHALSWRTDTLLKSLLVGVRKFTRYGFDLSGLALLAIAFLLASATFYDYANRIDIVHASDQERMQISTYYSGGNALLSNGVPCRGEPWRTLKQPKPEVSPSCWIQLLGATPGVVWKYAPTYPRFYSTLFAVDAMFPILGLHQTEYWTICDGSACGPREGSTADALLLTWPVRLSTAGAILIVFLLDRVLGGLVGLLLSIAVLSRIEALVARQESKEN